MECGKHGGGNCTVRSLFSLSVSRILSQRWDVEEAVETHVSGSKL
jgi:hypothetical protein